MKKMKKALSLLTVLTLVLASCVMLPACGEQLTPEQKFDAANANLKAADDVSLKNAVISAEIDMGGQTMEIPIDLNVDVINDKDDPLNTQMAMDMNANLFGQSMEIHMYLKDKTMYTDSSGTKTKTPLDDESMKQLQEYLAKNSDKDASIAEYVTESKEEDGVVTLKLDGAKMIKDAMSKVDEEQIDSDQIKTIEQTIDKIGLKTITCKATIEDENFKDLQYSTTLNIDPALMGMTADTTGETTDKMKIKIKVKFGEIKTNSGLKIEFPDFSDYKEAAAE